MVSEQIAKHFREIHFGGNWTTSSVKEHISDITWAQASVQIHSLNSIATLVYHINYYVSEVMKVLEGDTLNASDKFSFNSEHINSEEAWIQLRDKTISDAEKFASLVEKLPDEKLWQNLAHEKYGSYYRNLHGIIEHTHYHLGQIVVIKKLLKEQSDHSSNI